MHAATSRLPVFSQAAAASGKIVCNVWAPEWLGGPGAFETESDPHLALFHSMDRCFAAIAAWNWRAMQRQAARGAWCRISDAGAKPAMEALLAASLTASLTEREAKQVMALYGIPVVADALVQSASAACEAAATLITGWRRRGRELGFGAGIAQGYQPPGSGRHVGSPALQAPHA